MKTKVKFAFYSRVAVCWTFFSCSTPPNHSANHLDSANGVSPADPPARETATAKTDQIHSGASSETLVISYVLGRTKRKFRIELKNQQYIAQTILDRQTLMEGVIEKGRYENYLKKVFEFVQSFKKPDEAEINQCRTPFKIEWLIKSEMKVVEGCRSPDDIALSRLLREGEFLIYSKK